MKKLIAKIREILRNRRVRKIWTRTVSSIACLVVFVTTYALVLPAITMESQALCGIEAHQHDDSCYEERLTCTIPEADGHTHTEDCYSTKQKSICDRSEHLHTSDCYDENGNLTCGLEEHQHGRECFEETRELVCGLEEAEGHHHDSSCYEKVLTCGKEAHTHSQACYREDAASAMATERAAVAATTADSGDGNAAADVNGADGSSDAFGTLDPAQTDSEGFVPASDEASLQQPLNSDTAISNNSPAVDETRGSGNSDAGIISDDSSSAEENITEAVGETHPAVSFEDTLTVYTGSLGSDITGSLSSDTNAGNPGNDAAGSPDTDTAAGTFPASSNLTVSVSAEAGTFPAGTTMVLSAVTDMDAVAEAVEGTVDSKTRGFQAVDISFRDKDGNEIEPLKPISVTMRSDSIKAATEDSSMSPVVVHVEDRKKATAEAGDSPAATVIETLSDTAENKEKSETPDVINSPDAISFEADAFSVYAIVYTVDFHWGVNGKTYDFSIPGGGFVSLTDLVEVLDIIGDTNSVNIKEENRSEIAKNADEIGFNEGTEENGVNDGTNTALTLGDVEVSDAAKEFVADVASVEFSNPKLVDISKVESETTVGQIKERRGLEVEYSANLKEEQITEINAQAVEAGDWALISVQPFTSEETLTVTMKNGEAFTLKVTDAQITTKFLADSGKLFEVTVTYDESAQIPEGAKLRVTEFEKDEEEYITAWKALVAGKESRNEVVNPSSLGFAALDISIVLEDQEGNIIEEIEPAVPVKVDMKIKELPGVEDLTKVAETLEIQHHVKAKNGVIVENVFESGTEASFEMKTDADVIAVDGDSAVNPETVSDKNAPWHEENQIKLAEPSGVDDKGRLNKFGIDLPFETPSFSTFTVSWQTYYNWNWHNESATVKYVDEKGKELNISNSITPSTDKSANTYLIYDIDGYEYDYCYLNNDKSKKIYPYIGYYNGYFYYSEDREGHYLADNTVINVVYKKKDTPTKGGVPLVDRTSEEADPPSILKSSAENGDGTNTLSLSITGSQAPAKLVKLADIIVIFDCSGSMNFNMAGEELQEYGTVYSEWNDESRIKQAYDALDGFAESMLSKKNSEGEPLVRMSLISFSNTAKVESGFTSDKDELMSAVQGLVGDGGTNWEHALQLANNKFRMAADETNVGPMELDPNRATFVVFITDGQPTFRMTRDNVKNNEFYENDDSKRDIALQDYCFDHVFGHGMADYYNRDYKAALKEATSIVNNEKILYSIGISGTESELANLGQLVSDAGAGEGHSVVATTQNKLIEAFDDIAEKIAGYTGQADIKMFDGITGLTNTISKVNQTDHNRLLGVDGDFTYWKAFAPADWKTWTANQKSAYTQGMDYANTSSTPEEYESWQDEEKAAFQEGKNATFTEWTTREEDGCAEAVYNTGTGAVEWNMGETFMLENGVTYKVSFDCWPSQKAYDILAKLNNGTITFGDTALYGNDVWTQFEGDATSGYRLKTNAEGANTSYRKAENINGTLTIDDKRKTLEFQHVPPMPLDKDKLNVAKTWQASKIDTQTPESVILQVVGDNELYKQFEIEPTETANGSATPNKGKSDDIYISCGHLKVNKDTGEVVVYESGHDFTLREVEENSRHWDLDASICRPMKINTHETMLIRVEGDKVPAGMADSVNYYASGNDEYYRIDGKVYKDTKAWADITGANTRRSFLDLVKEVLVDNKVWTEPVDTKFTYKIKINIDPTTLSWDPDLEKYIIISVRGDGYSPAAAIADTTYLTTAKLPSQSGMPSTLIHEGDDNLYLVAESGVEFYLSIKSGWSVRFLNLPSGTTYSIEEVLPEDSDYDFNNARLEIRKDSSSAAPLSKKEYSTVKVEEGITETSTLYKVVYQNDAKGKEVQILKTEQDASTPLGDAKFDLYTESAYISDPQGAPFKPNLVSSNQTDKKGQIDLGKLPVGKYYLVETKAPDGYTMRTDPVVITVSKSSVTYSDGTNLSMSGSGISQIGDVFQLKVTNDAGVELPSTGGPGTCLFTILGSILILGAGTLLWRRRRFI